MIKEILADLSASSALAHARELTAFGQRLNTAAEGAAEYIEAALKRAGLTTELQRFRIYTSAPGEAVLRLLEPEERAIPCRAYAHVDPTPKGGLTAELLYVGPGREEDYDGLDARGKIVLAELIPGPARPEKARIAAANGAVGLIVIDWGPLDNPITSNGALKGVWGIPTRNTLPLIPHIPGVGVSRREGEMLRQLAQKGAAVVQLSVSCAREWKGVVQPIGTIQAPEASGEFILVAGHFDAWGPGATDNAAGNGLMLELARVFSRYRKHLKRNIVFAFWNGHEVAEASGSTWFVDSWWDAIKQGAVVHLNIDQPGLKGTEKFQVFSTPELQGFAVKVPEQLLGERVIPAVLRGKHSDQSFYGAGVPSLLGQTVFPPDKIAEMGGAALGWWWHNEADTLDKIDLVPLERSLRVFAAYVLASGTAEFPPYDFAGYVKVFEEGLAHLDRLLPKLPSRAKDDLALIKGLVNRLKPFLSHMRAGCGVDHVQGSRCLIELSRRLIPMLFTVTGPYEQDPYGFYDLEFPLPISYPLQRLAQIPPSSPAYEMYLVEYLRRRNRLADSLADTISFLDKECRFFLSC